MSDVVERLCRTCSLAISHDEEVILAYCALPALIKEHDLKPLDGNRPEIFHAGHLPRGWLLMGFPMPVDEALERLR